MSITLFEFAKSFVNERLNACVFSNAYIELWRVEGWLGLCKLDDSKFSGCLSSIFCVADLYNPSSDREEHEFDEAQLRAKVSEIIQRAESGV